jgi:3-methyladenine DNA glycosylase AlkD
MTAGNVIKDLNNYASKERAKNLSKFFKTGKGEYGEGDKFIGVVVPNIRTVAKKYKELPLKEIQKILNSKIHEHRLTALIILTYKFPRADELLKKDIVSFYIKNTKQINNWDLVDLSALYILGKYFSNHNKEKNILYDLAISKNIWERRISILTTFEFIRNNQFEDSLKIAEILLKDDHDLIHKAVGWMLREIGKRDLKTEEQFLQHHYKSMPRTMLRYAIEKFPEKKRQFYLLKK